MHRVRQRPDLLQGPILKKLIYFTIPLILATTLQLLFVSVDKIVLGQYVGDEAMGAVGATSSLIHLVINVFNGLSIGVSIAVAQFYGAREEKAVSEVVHSSVIAALFCGIIVAVIGITLSDVLLKAMDTPEEILVEASVYLRIYFIGSPAFMLFNYCAAALRSVGNTFSPMIILIVSGLLNLALNLILVVVCKMGIAGVAWATVASQVMSAVLVLIVLSRSDDCLKFQFKKLKANFKYIFLICKLGIPAGVQNFIFSVANVSIQTGVNSFGKVGTAGNTAASDVEGYLNAIINSFFNTTLTFVGQNIGGKKYDRIPKIFKTCMLSALTVCFGVCGLVFLLRYPLLGLYSSNAEIIEFGTYKLTMLCASYFTYGMMQVFIGAIRGMGKTVIPMFISLFGICIVRLIWLYTIFAAIHDPMVLYACYPVSWVITAIMQGVYYVILKNRFMKKIEDEKQAEDLLTTTQE